MLRRGLQPARALRSRALPIGCSPLYGPRSSVHPLVRRLCVSTKPVIMVGAQPQLAEDSTVAGTPQPTPTDFSSHVKALAWPERHGIAAGLVLLGGSSAISLVFPKVTMLGLHPFRLLRPAQRSARCTQVMGHVMDLCLSGTADLGPSTAAAGLLALFGAQSFLVAARARVLVTVGERVANGLREKTFASLLRQAWLYLLPLDAVRVARTSCPAPPQTRARLTHRSHMMALLMHC